MSPSQTKQTQIHVIFADGGIPAWFGPEPVPGSEPLTLAELRPLLPDGVDGFETPAVWRALLIRHCRIDGVWRLRPMPTGTGLVQDQPTELPLDDKADPEVPEAPAGP